MLVLRCHCFVEVTKIQVMSKRAILRGVSRGSPLGNQPPGLMGLALW